MPIKRQSKIPAESTAFELLSHLAINGYLDYVDVPEWAEGGTSFEEMLLTLQEQLGSGGHWLPKIYDSDIENAAHSWFSDWAYGKEVLTAQEGRTLPNPDDDDEDD